jgi:hypothetical protein
MKLFLKLMLAALVITILLPFTILKDDQGKPLMSISSFNLPDFKMPDMPNMPDMPSSKQLVPSAGDRAGKDIVYQWNDSQGNIHFTTEPPVDGIQFTVKGYDPNANVIQAVKLPEIEVPEESVASGSDGQDSASGLENTYSKEDIQKLIDDSKNIQQLLNQRHNNQNSVINQ